MPWNCPNQRKKQYIAGLALPLQERSTFVCPILSRSTATIITPTNKVICPVSRNKLFKKRYHASPFCSPVMLLCSCADTPCVVERTRYRQCC